MSLLSQLGGLSPAVMLPWAGALLVVLWLGWRKPTWLLLFALTSLAIRPQLLWGGSDIGYEWGLHQTLIVLALATNALHYGVRRTVPWPILALVAAFVLSLAFGDLHPKLTLPFMLMSLAILALPWIFVQVVLEPGSRQKYAMALALVPLGSVVIGALLNLAEIRPLINVEATGALRLQGAAGIPADLGLLAFAGFASAMHESTRTTNRYFTYLAYLNFALVVLSGTRMAIAAGVLLFSTYFLFFPPMRERWRQNVVTAALGLGLIVLAGVFYLPNLELRMFGGDGSIGLSGRDAMWSFYLDEFLMSPIFGRGIGAGFVAFAPYTDFGLPTPHNEYLHLLVIGGMVGFLLCVGAIALWFRDLVRIYKWDDRTLVYALLPALALYAMTENLLILPSALPIFAYLGVMRTRSMRDLAPDATAERETGFLRTLRSSASRAFAPPWRSPTETAGLSRDRASNLQPLAVARGRVTGRRP